jgi:hypothetical protein
VVAWRRPARSRAAAVGFLGGLALYAALSGLAHDTVRRAVVEAERERGRSVAEAYALPLPFAPLRWQGIAVAPASVPEPRVARYGTAGVPPRLGPPERIARGFDDPWARRALATREGQAYLWWAVVPVARVEAGPDTARVTLSDLRFRRTILPTAEGQGPFTLRFDFDPKAASLRDVEWR